jgi:hypothetical protein
MNNAEVSYLLPLYDSKRHPVPLTQKEIAMLRLAKQSGFSLEATAKVILLLRARKTAVNQKEVMA